MRPIKYPALIALSGFCIAKIPMTLNTATSPVSPANTMQIIAPTFMLYLSSILPIGFLSPQLVTGWGQVHW
jgi:hypothetical protein